MVEDHIGVLLGPKTRSAGSVGHPGYPREADRTPVIRLEDMTDAVSRYQPGESWAITLDAGRVRYGMWTGTIRGPE